MTHFAEDKSKPDTQFHLQQQVDLGHALQVLLADGDVVLQGFLGQIQHVGGEEGLTVLLEVFFTGLSRKGNGLKQPSQRDSPTPKVIMSGGNPRSLNQQPG